MRSVRDERRKAEREYYQQLVDAATDAPFGGTTDGSRVVESPLESILRNHTHEAYSLHCTRHVTRQVIVDYQRALGKIALEKQLLTEKTMRNFPHDPDHPERLSQLLR
ncbi:hypothetical protein GBAR_LOCUS8814 [Geodia barretti]|uniref:Uncharacterized protein n=1 Tax=Geodia barretti TaxID=519541 RepID=A0AA35RM21_GEOBA|nr:hypothetical protein GBAR_LOCUS8814 [Geodia barretti]